MNTWTPRRVWPDAESSSPEYAKRFAGGVGAFFLETQLEEVVNRLQESSCHSVLDVGGGHAQLSAPLVERGFAVTLLGSANACRLLMDRRLPAGGFDFQLGDLCPLPFADDAFDAVVAVRMLAHLEEWQDMLSEMCRVAKNTVIVDFPARQVWNSLGSLGFLVKNAIERDTRRYRSFSESEVVDQITSSGFEPSASYRQFAFPMAFHRAFRSPRLSRIAERAGRAVGLSSKIGSPVLLTAKAMSAR